MNFCIRTLALLVLGLVSLPGSAATAKELLDAGRVDDAIAALQSQPSNAESQNLLCRAYYNVQNWDRAIAACEKATNLAQTNSWYHLWLGRAYGQKASHANFVTAASLAKKVRAEFERSVELDPQNAQARSDLAEFYLEAPSIMGGGMEKAATQAQVLSKTDPALGDRMMGRIAERNKNYAEAEKRYRAAALTSNSGDLWNDLAQFYQRQSRFDEMEHTIQRVPQAKTDQQASLVESAELLLNSGRNFSGATELLRQYLAKASGEQTPKAHYLLGTLFEKQGDKNSAAQEYRNALSIARGFASAQVALNRVSH